MSEIFCAAAVNKQKQRYQLRLTSSKKNKPQKVTHKHTHTHKKRLLISSYQGSNREILYIDLNVSKTSGESYIISSRMRL